MNRWIWGLIPALLHCSVVFEPPPARQCSLDSDCKALGAPGAWSCDTIAGVCVSAAMTAAGCESTEACVAANEGRPALCRFPGTPCVMLATPECPRVSGEWSAGDALFVGSVGTQTLRQADGSAPEHEHVERMLQAVDLGIEEWNREVPEGLFTSRRSIAMVQCDSEGDPAIAQQAMAHLLNDVDVPAVLALTDIDQEAIEEQALAADATLVGVECNEPEQLPPQIEGGLVWRMLPALQEQAELASWRVSDLELRIRGERALAESTPIRVAVWADAGAAFDAYVARVRGALHFNRGLSVDDNEGNYLELRNVDSRYEGQPLLQTVQRVFDFMPDIIVAAIDEDFTTYYLRILEAQWPASVPRPQYVLTALNQELSVLSSVVARDDDLRRRLSGTGIGLDADVSNNEAGFRARYRERYGSDPGRTQVAYDAWYATALAIYSADAGGRLDGANIAAHFPRLASGSLTNVDPLSLGAARAWLSAQRDIDLVGASSQLDWDPFTRRVRADAVLWCLSRDADGALQLDEDAGVRWTSSGASGVYDCP